MMTTKLDRIWIAVFMVAGILLVAAPARAADCSKDFCAAGCQDAWGLLTDLFNCAILVLEENHSSVGESRLCMPCAR